MIELDLEFEILEKLYNAPYHTLRRVELANSFDKDTAVADNIIESLKKKGLIVQKLGSELVSLKRPEGIEQFLLERQRRDNNAKQAAQKDAEQRAKVLQSKKDKKQEFRQNLIISLVSAAFGSFITLCIEHFQEIINAVSSFFSSFAA